MDQSSVLGMRRLWNPASNGLVEAEVKIYDQLKNMTAYNSASNGLVEKRVLRSIEGFGG